MSYAAAIDNLSALIPELFVTPGANSNSPRRKFSLREIGILCAALGDPQLQFPSVLIAGTNGKGSTASTLASIARESGLHVGLYTSPHLDRPNERIKLDGLDIQDEDFARFYFKVHDTAQQLVLDHTLEHLPSYFELLTALAFLAFAEGSPNGPVDLAVLEVGMGGRLDATNIVSPILSVITDISLDHQEWLGETIALIAREKAGILRPNGTLVTLPQHPEANQAIGEVATELDVRGVSAVEYMPQIGAAPDAPYSIQVQGSEILVDSPLKGAHQHRNIALAIASAVELSHDPAFPITPASIERGIHNTRWPGRLEHMTLPGQPEFLPPEIILDVAHNPAGAWTLRAALAQVPEELPRTLIFSCLRDKDIREMTQILLPLFDSSSPDRPHDHILFASISSPRAASLEELSAAAHDLDVPASTMPSVAEALAEARRITPANGLIVATGSIFLVGELRTLVVGQYI